MFSNVLVRSVKVRLFSVGLWMAAFGVCRAADEPQEPSEPAAVVSDQLQSVLKGGPRKPKETTPSSDSSEEAANQGSEKEEGPLEPIEIDESKDETKKTTTTDSSPAPSDPADSNSEESNPEETDAEGVKKRIVGGANVQDLIKPIRLQQVSLEGIEVEQSTVEDLRRAWGEPRDILDNENEDGGSTLVFDHAQLGAIQVMVKDSRVEQLLIQLDKSLTPRDACRLLKISETLGVDVSNNRGRLLGRAYPEHGVILSFQGGQRLPVVRHIIIEPINAEAFVTRVESDLHGRYLANLADLQFALKLDPEYAQAHWLSARVHLATGQFDTAREAAERAAQLAPEEDLYQITQAHCLAASGKHKRAIRKVEELLKNSELEPVVRAAALSLQGELVAARDGANTSKAMRYHTRAIKIADPLAVSADDQVRRLAKEILLETHLAVARDIAWGNWKKKEDVVPRWLERASAFAEESIDNEGGSLELRLRVAELLSVSGVAGQEPVLKYLAKDFDAIVQLMAKAALEAG